MASSSSSSPYDRPSSSYPPPPRTASSRYIIAQAREILQTLDLTELTELVTKLCYGKEKDEYSELLFDSFKHRFPNLLAVRLLHLYKFAALKSAMIRSYSLSLLDSHLIDLEESRTYLKTEALHEIKYQLNDCLLQQETSDHDFKLLARIISRVAVDIFINNIVWDELCSYTISLLEGGSKKALLIFGELPMVLDEEFVMPLLDNNLGVKIVKGLVNPDCDEKWCLALEAGFSLMLQLVNLGRQDTVWDMVYAIVNSVWEMVNVKKREIVVRKGMIRIARKVRREAMRFRDPEYEVVSRLALMLKRINGLGKITEMAAETIHEVLDSNYMDGKGLDLDFIQATLC